MTAEYPSADAGRQPTLWYTHPASDWNAALPLGNGRLGAMVFGDPFQERIPLNEETLWTGYPRDSTVPDAVLRLEEVRQLLECGKNLDAQAIIEKTMLGSEGDAYLPLGDLLLRFPETTPVTDYRRELFLADGLCTVSYRAGDTMYRREMLASAVHDVLAFRFTASGSDPLCFEASMTSPLRHNITGTANRLFMEGECPSDNDMQYSSLPEQKGVRFFCCLEMHSDGIVGQNDGRLSVRDAHEAVLYLSVKTSFQGYDTPPVPGDSAYPEKCLDVLNALPPDYAAVQHAHIRDFRSLFDRVALSLTENHRAALPTDERLEAFQKDKDDPGLYPLLFHYGRYLLISSSRENSQPSNLQGIWNAELRAPWKSNYTLNINTEMNYWPAPVCNLPELQRPLLRMTRELAEAGKKTARVHYGARGFVCHHNTDLWRKTTPVCGRANHAYWNMGGVWLSWQMFEHYRFTLDRDYLKNDAYPVMKEAALFCLDQLRTGQNGLLHATPSTSPENWFLSKGSPCAVSSYTTMSNALIRHLFRACIRAAEELRIDSAFRDELAACLDRLEPYHIGSRGQLLEWDKEYPETDPHHRHISQIFGLYPGEDLLDPDHPEWVDACRRTLSERGDDGAGWSLAWKVCLWARLRDGNHALRLLQNQLRAVRTSTISYEGGGGSYPNLLDAHPPFQIDGNFGITAGIAEMLMQSHHNRIRLLPALPDDWKEGAVRGLLARGNIRVDILWHDGQLTQAAFHAGDNTSLRIEYQDIHAVFSLAQGASIQVDGLLRPICPIY